MSPFVLLLACTDAKSTNDTGVPVEDIAPGDDTATTPPIVVENRTEGWMLLINEFYVVDNDGGHGDWIELYNAGTVDVDFAALVLQTSGDSGENRSLSSLGLLGPAQFLFLESGDVATGLFFGLRWEGDVIGICETQCMTGAGDRLSYGAYAGESGGLTRARATDGGDEWIYGNPTPGFGNL